MPSPSSSPPKKGEEKARIVFLGMASSLARTRKLAGSHRFFEARTNPQLAPWLASLNFHQKKNSFPQILIFDLFFF